VGSNGSGQRILVVDDEPSIVDAVATALRYEGYAVDEAVSGREALESVTRHEPDLIVLDWMLPDIDGLEVGRRLRARGFKTAVLFLTAKDATESKVEALRAGGDDYVTKPDGATIIEVEDGGTGVAVDEVERVFERFYRADDSRSRASGGVGLGLSIVAAVAEAHGGSVAARSESGKGSTFTITLPLAHAHGSGDET
jgi:CheY-like chemotaxis protein